MAKGGELTQRVVNSETAMVQVVAEGDKWWDYATRLLAILFDTPAFSDEYREKVR